jgi:hypothetical protein
MGNAQATRIHACPLVCSALPRACPETRWNGRMINYLADLNLKKTIWQPVLLRPLVLIILFRNQDAHVSSAIPVD